MEERNSSVFVFTLTLDCGKSECHSDLQESHVNARRIQLRIGPWCLLLFAEEGCLANDAGLMGLLCSAMRLRGKQQGNHRVLKEIGISQLNARLNLQAPKCSSRLTKSLSPNRSWSKVGVVCIEGQQNFKLLILGIVYT